MLMMSQRCSDGVTARMLLDAVPCWSADADEDAGRAHPLETAMSGAKCISRLTWPDNAFARVR